MTAPDVAGEAAGAERTEETDGWPDPRRLPDPVPLPWPEAELIDGPQESEDEAE